MFIAYISNIMYSENMKNNIQNISLAYEQFSINQYYTEQRHTMLHILF